MKFRALLASLLFASISALTPDAVAHSGSTVDGVLTHVVGTAKPGYVGMGGGRHFSVRADDGHDVPVELSGADLPAGGAKALLNKRVRVTAAPGVAMQNLGFGQRLSATRVQLAPPSSGSAVDALNDVFPMSGSRRYLSILCQSNGGASQPASPPFFETQLGDTYPGFNHYFAEMSYGRANIDNSHAAPAWVLMPQTNAQIVAASPLLPGGGHNYNIYLKNIAQTCVNAAKASGVSFAGYVGVNLMFNGEVDNCCAWGGSQFLALEAGPTERLVSVTWMPFYSGSDFGWLDHSVLAHELSHSFGSPHSDGPGGYQYNNQWDVVSRPGGTCATVDAEYGCVGQHAVGDNKLAMDFIAPARVRTHEAGAASATVTLERMAQPPNAGGTYQLLKVKTPDIHKYYTVEARKRIGYDQNLPGDGVIIHEVIDNRPKYPGGDANNPGDPARLLRPDGVTTPVTSFALGGAGAIWGVGSAYINVSDDVKITVVSFDASGNASVKVEPASTPGEYNFTVASIDVTEGAAASVNLAVTRSAPFTGAGSLTWTTSGNTAIAGTDYGTSGNGTQKTGTLAWTAGTGGVKNITIGLPAANIPVINDPAVEANKSFNVTLSNPVGSFLGAQSQAAVNILDVNSVIQFQSTTATVGEIGGNTTLTVVRTGSTTTSQTFTWSTSNGTAVAPGDYTTSSSSITFTPGQTSKTLTIGPQVVSAPYVRVLADGLVEINETFNITLSAPTGGASIGAAGVAVVTVTSMDSSISMGAATRSFAEGAGAQNLTVTRNGTAGAASINYAFTSGTAINNTHFIGTNGTLNWADGEGGSKLIPVTILDDSIINASRAFTVTLSNPVVSAAVAPLSTAVTLTDNDNLVQFSATAATISESAANIVLSVARTGVTTQAASVQWTAFSGTATAGVDFGASTGTLNWAAADATSKTITIPILPDSLVEGTENFTVSLANPGGPGVSIGVKQTVTVSLTDDDKGFAFLPATYEVTEGTASVTITVQRVGSSVGVASATWTTVNGTATAGQDFGTAGNAAQKTGTLSWPTGNVTNKTIVIPILNDLIGGEGDETFTVVLTPAAGFIVAAPGAATVTIHDNDLPPSSNVEFTQPKYVVAENGGSVILSVNRFNIAPQNVAATVQYATVAGTALATSDYTTKSGTLNWAAGETGTRDITIAITNNAVAEATEAFRVVLSAPSSGTELGTLGEATVAILDDDEVFPRGGAMPAGFSTCGCTTTGWHVSSDAGAFEGLYSLKANQVEDNQSAGIEMTGTFAAGNVSFRFKVSSEATFDQLRFYIDDVLQAPVWSGSANTAWQLSPTYTIGAGNHVLKWAYAKDASGSVGMDTVYIDGLVTPAFTPAP